MKKILLILLAVSCLTYIPKMVMATTITTILSGADHFLVHRSDGTTLAWGNNDSGQCNIPIAAQTQISAVSAGWMFSLAIKNGTVIAWGDNTYGQIDVPTQALSGVTAIAAGGTFALALKSGQVIAWGDNCYGQTTVPVEAQSGVIAISAGFAHALALKSDGTVVSWGANFSNQATIPIAANTGVKAIAAGAVHSLALKTDGTVVAWGDPSLNATAIPPAVQTGVTAISAGGNFSMAIKGSTATIWGDAPAGTPPNDWNIASMISAGGGIASVLTTSGQASVWGNATPGVNDLLLVTVSLAGSGNGTVNSVPSGIACTAGACSTSFTNGTVLKLVPTVATGSHFSGWTGDCTGVDTCQKSLAATMHAIATFDIGSNHARLLETGATFQSIAQALVAASTKSTVQLTVEPITEDVSLPYEKTITLQGGFDQTFTTRSGPAKIIGIVKIIHGSLISDGIIIGSP